MSEFIKNNKTVVLAVGVIVILIIVGIVTS